MLPATGAILAYLNARLGISYDLSLLSAYIQTRNRLAALDRRDELNLFYVLECFAVGRPNANVDVSKTAELVFMVFRNREWTFKQTYETVLKYGTWFKTQLGVRSGDIVAVDFMNGDIFVFIWFGLWAIGAKPAFVNYNVTGASLVHCVRASAARILLVDPELALPPSVVGELASGGEKRNHTENTVSSVKTVIFSSELEQEILTTDAIRQPDEERADQKPSDMAALIFTSGTTGLPKPAVISWVKAGIASLFVSNYMSLSADDRLYTVSMKCISVYNRDSELSLSHDTAKPSFTLLANGTFSVCLFTIQLQLLLVSAPLFKEGALYA